MFVNCKWMTKLITSLIAATAILVFGHHYFHNLNSVPQNDESGKRWPAITMLVEKRMKTEKLVNPSGSNVSVSEIARCDSYERNTTNKNRIYNLVMDRFEKICDKEVFLFFNEGALKLSEKFIVDKPNYCGADKGRNLYLMLMVYSNVDDPEQRSLIRETWGAEVRQRGAKLLFLVAQSYKNDVQENLLFEDKQHGDVIQSSFMEDYYNMTLKSYAHFHWMDKECTNVKFAARSDEDMVVNVDLLFQTLKKNENQKKLILGEAHNGLVERDEGNKWWLPQFIHKNDTYHIHVDGGFYLLTGDAVSPIIHQALRLTPHYVDDVFFTGVVAEIAGVRRESLHWGGLYGTGVAYHGLRGAQFKLIDFGVKNHLVPMKKIIGIDEARFIGNVFGFHQ